MGTWIGRLRDLPASRRGSWAVLGFWLLVAAGFAPLQPRLQDATTNDPASFLPASADSTRVLDTLDERFRSGRQTPALIVYQRMGGLTERDREAIAADLDGIAAERFPDAAPAVSPLSPGAVRQGLVSEDGTTAVAVVPITARTIDGIEPVVDGVRDIVSDSPPEGLAVYVTGPAGITVDAVEVFGAIDATLLLATSALILVLLLVIYRSPVVAFVPLFVVAIAYSIAAGFVYLLIEAADLTVNGQTTGILIILMFGAGTDYCLLIVSRFREELRRREDKHEAMRLTLARTSPAILSSGGTVMVAMLVLLVADLQTFRSSGPVFALGIFVTMLAGLTLLPALLTIFGRRAFWPAIPRADGERPGVSGFWHRVGTAVMRRPGVVLTATLIGLGAATLGNLVDLPGLSLGAGFRGQVESIQGQQALAKALPAGEAATTDVLVASPRADAASRAVAAVPGVAAVRPQQSSDDGELARLSVTLDDDPYGDAAIARIDDLRAAAERVDPDALVGGPTAEEADTRSAVRHDVRLIVPITLAAIFLILVVLLRGVVVSAYLIASVVLSFAATLGLSYLAFAYVFDSPGSDPSLPVFVFIFVVALGVDYNIFLMTRVREEVRRTNVREGVLHGLERTGGVITSAGVILAGTFLVLMVLPLEQLFQLGFAVALGVLIDTFVVRTLLVPALAFRLGRWSWWPSLPPSPIRPVRADRA